MKDKYFCLTCYDQNFIIECGCGCGQVLTKYSKYHKLKTFLKNHNSRWKGGRSKNKKYWTLYLPDYFSSSKQGRVYEHIYFYQEYHKVCVLKWAVVHHIEPVTEDYCNNMPWNLETMMKPQHISYHHSGKQGKRKDMSGRRCKYCNEKTYIDKNGSEQWCGNEEDGFFCRRCYDRIRRSKKKLN